jgi:alpha-tubulin suppressor-like RCC1 family protein/pimeloyl-ACP methyl ester carboxylesterase
MRRLLPAGTLLVLVSAAACKDGGGTSVPNPGGGVTVASVTVAPDTPLVTIGTSLPLIARANDASGAAVAGATFTWSSADTSIATVDGSGVVTGRRIGVTVVSARASSVVGRTYITVVAGGRDSAVVVGTSATVVQTGFGSTVTIPAGALPPGSMVVLDTVAGGGDDQLGGELRLTLTAPAASSAYRAEASGSGGSPSIVLRVRSRISATAGAIASHLFFNVVDRDDTARSVGLPPDSARQWTDPAGRSFVEETVHLPLTTDAPSGSLSSRLSIHLSIFDTECTDADVWQLANHAVSSGGDRIPIVLIHGWSPDPMSGATTCRGVKKLDPAKETWSRLVNIINAPVGGLHDEYEVWVYRYPAFMSVAANASHLAALLQQNGLISRRPVLVAHSMGGLVAARYMVDNDGGNVRQLVTLGTPFRGSPLAVKPDLTVEQNSAYKSCMKSAASLVSRGWVDAEQLAIPHALDTPGAHDLREPGLAGDLTPHAGVFAPRLATVRGQVDWTEIGKNSGHTRELIAGGCTLAALSRVPNDGIVPDESASAFGTELVSPPHGVDHIQLTEADATMDALVGDLLVLYARSLVPAAVSAAFGDGQTGAPGQQVGDIGARVTDAHGTPIPGVQVSFAVTAGGGTVAAGPLVTGDDGVARSGWILGPAPGANAATATVLGHAELHVTFHATASGTVQPTVTPHTLSVGGGHACAIDVNGDAWCWGVNRSGQVGDGTNADAATPHRVSGDLKFRSIAAGGMHTCAITTSGAMYCWGEASDGQIGNGTNVNSPTPVHVASDSQFVDVAAGASHTCGVASGGHVLCWGFNRIGQLGIGVQTEDELSPRLAETSVLFVSVAVGTTHTCGLSRSGLAFCWGMGGLGQLGVQSVAGQCFIPAGTMPCSTVPVPVEGHHVFTSLTAGGDHACGLALEGMYCWGSTPGTYVGQSYGLGDGTQSNSFTPIPVASGISSSVIDAGLKHTCAIGAARKGWCWGQNLHGQLGDATQTDQTSPDSLVGNHAWTAISAGDVATCGLTAAGEVWCWGYRYYGGYVGDGTNGGTLLPARATLPTSIAQPVAALRSRPATPSFVRRRRR